MGWREDLIAQHEKEITQLQQGIDWMERGIMETGNLDAVGRKQDTTGESIQNYKRIVGELERLVEKIKADVDAGRS